VADRRSGTGEQQTQVIVDLGLRGDGRARIFCRIFLPDRDGGRDARDLIDIGLVHAFEELACVSRQGFDITPLAFGIERVKSKRRFSRTRNARDHRQLIDRQSDSDVFEIMNAGPANDDLFLF